MPEDNYPLFPPDDDDSANEALAELAREMRAHETRRQSVSPEELESAIRVTIEFLRTGWTSGGGRRLRRFVWSLWNGWHLVNLCELSDGLDGTLTDAVIVLFRASMVDVLTDAQKRRILLESGEMQRWEDCAAETPENETVLYPPLMWSSEDLQNLAASSKAADRRYAAKLKAEQLANL
jgi:hypothetical protein